MPLFLLLELLNVTLQGTCGCLGVFLFLFLSVHGRQAQISGDVHDAALAQFQFYHNFM